MEHIFEAWDKLMVFHSDMATDKNFRHVHSDYSHHIATLASFQIDPTVHGFSTKVNAAAKSFLRHQ